MRQKVRSLQKIGVGVSVVVGLLAIGSGCGGGSTPRSANIPFVQYVFLLVEENHSYESVIGNSAMPYTNSLAQQYALATQYYANQHQSLPNYFMLTVGKHIADDDFFTGSVMSDNVARALTRAGKSWKVYAEGLPSAGYVGPSETLYSKHHNPFSYFSDVLDDNSQAANIVPLSQLAADFQSGTLPNYAMIVPDLTDDAHDCPGESAKCAENDKLATADQWIKANLSPLINSTAFQDSVLIYTWDESELDDTANGGGHVATILIGPKVRAGYRSTTFYQHESTLRLTLELLGVSDLPGAAAKAPDMGEFF